jgi:hypothetical protein
MPTSSFEQEFKIEDPVVIAKLIEQLEEIDEKSEKQPFIFDWKLLKQKEEEALKAFRALFKS